MPFLSRTVRRYAIGLATRVLPPTRLYKLRNAGYRWAGVAVASDARIVSSTSFIGPGDITIGPRSFVGHECLVIAAGGSISIGADVDIGPRVFIGNGTHTIDMASGRAAGPGTTGDVTIGNGVWIGAGSIILPGVTIGATAVIAAGSVVTSDIPALVVAAGVPCRVKKRWDGHSGRWSRLGGDS